MYVFNVNIDGNKMTIPCRAYAVVKQAPWNGYLQLADVQNMADDILPNHKVKNIFMPQSNTNWFAELEKLPEPEVVEEPEVEEELEIEETLAVPQPPKQKRKTKKPRK